MARRVLVPTALLCSLAGVASAAPGRPIVAVFAVEARSVRLRPEVLVSLTSYLASKLSESGEYEVVPQDKLKRALTTRKKESYRQCYDQSCQIEIGQELAANRALSTQIMKVGTRCVVACNLYDLKKSTSAKAATAKGDCSEDGVTASIDLVVEKLTRRAPSPTAEQPGSARSVTSPEPAPRDHAGARPPTGPRSTTLGRQDIQTGMRGVAGLVRRCYDRHRVPGSAVVNVTIGPSGLISAVRVSGPFAGTATGACVEGAVRTATFPRFDGRAVTITYPFILR